MRLVRPPVNDAEIPRWRQWITDILRGRMMHGIVWDDVYPSSVATFPGANAPSGTAYAGNLKAYEFVANATKDVTVIFQFPHAREDDTFIVPHIHIYAPSDGSGGNVRFGLEYFWGDVGETGAISTSTIYGDKTLAASTIYRNEILSFGEIVGTGKGLSSVLHCRIFRNPAATEDTFGSSVWLLSADVHAQRSWLGSFFQFSRKA